jgi:hypothetical protein
MFNTCDFWDAIIEGINLPNFSIDPEDDNESQRFYRFTDTYKAKCTGSGYSVIIKGHTASKEQMISHMKSERMNL